MAALAQDSGAPDATPVHRQHRGGALVAGSLTPTPASDDRRITATGPRLPSPGGKRVPVSYAALSLSRSPASPAQPRHVARTALDVTESGTRPWEVKLLEQTIENKGLKRTIASLEERLRQSVLSQNQVPGSSVTVALWSRLFLESQLSPHTQAWLSLPLHSTAPHMHCRSLHVAAAACPPPRVLRRPLLLLLLVMPLLPLVVEVLLSRLLLLAARRRRRRRRRLWRRG
jgi:hypothetical protein